MFFIHTNYPKFSEIYSIYKVDVDNNDVEQHILKIFSQLFIKESDYGNEYFNGDFRIMVQIIELYLTTNNYTFEKIDLYQSFIQNSISNQIIYNSENWNVKVYNHIQNVMKEENITSFMSIQDYNQFYKTHFFVKKNKIEEIEEIDEIEEIEEIDEIKEIKDDKIEEIEKVEKINKVQKYKNINQLTKVINNYNKINYNEDKSNKTLYYICYYCKTYISHRRKDMINHCNRKIKCACNSNKLYEDCELLSCNIKFYFYFDIKALQNDDFIFIVDNYNKDENHIYKNFKNNMIINNIMSDNIQTLYIKENNEIISDNVLDDFNKLYFNFDKQKYVCNICLSEYFSKQNMERHIFNTKQCNKKRILVEAIIKNKYKNININI